MNQKYYKWLILLFLLMILVLLAFSLSLMYGEMRLSLPQLLDVLSEKEGLKYVIIRKIRLPRTIMAFAVGGSLSLTGAIL
ncbi:MAG TPA: iron chelate uptake ABC transporter family permease subunit, partial [Prolixibacteraceae bacterium]|nr:iron chelate uptake ABC transporter family permease subunit [Prolixibacteraceae bacterium]